MYYYDQGLSGNVCIDCVSKYTENDEFFGLKGVYVCKTHNACLLFESKDVKKRFNNDEDARNEYEQFKEKNTWIEQPTKELNGEWMNKDDVFNIIVTENETFSPDSFSFNNNPIVMEALQHFESSAAERGQTIVSTDKLATQNDELENETEIEQIFEEVINQDQLLIKDTDKIHDSMEIDINTNLMEDKFEDIQVMTQELDLNPQETIDILNNQLAITIK